MNGIICVNKPSGFTSFDIVAITRRVCGTKKVGHTGTLDPAAKGVLPVFVGGATKAIDLCPDTDKEYIASFKLGITTDTQDITGKILTEQSVAIGESELLNAISRFAGETEQLPPMYSAVKINGRKLYDLARKGETVEQGLIKPRKITVYGISLDNYRIRTGEGTMTVKCSKGVYVRTLIHDIGNVLGCGAVMTDLTRTKANGFGLGDCIEVDRLKGLSAREAEELALPLAELFRDYPKVRLDKEQTARFRNGAELAAERCKLEKKSGGKTNLYAVYGDAGDFVGLAEVSGLSLKITGRFKQ